MGYLGTVLGYLHSIAGPSIMLIYPLFASVHALESPSKVDDEQWLAYWILYSFLTLMEIVAEPVLRWIPIWYEMKMVVVAWLVLPQFRGSAFVYNKFVRQQLGKRGEDKVEAVAVADGADGQSSSSSSPKKANSSSSNKGKHKFLGFLKPKKVT